MSLPAQAKILRAVEYGEFERLGSETLKAADVRLVSATHFPLARFHGPNGFRKDLFYRINGFTLTLPPLRERQRDLPLLLAAEIAGASRKQQKSIMGLERTAAARLFAHSWPGNLRELSRVIEAAVGSRPGCHRRRRPAPRYRVFASGFPQRGRVVRRRDPDPRGSRATACPFGAPALLWQQAPRRPSAGRVAIDARPQAGALRPVSDRYHRRDRWGRFEIIPATRVEHVLKTTHAGSGPSGDSREPASLLQVRGVLTGKNVVGRGR